MTRKLAIALISVLSLSSPSLVMATNGHVLHGVGSTNQAMGGAGIATGIDAIGAMHNNVSSIALIKDNVINLGFELFIPERSMYASAGGASGTVKSQTREAPIPSMAVIYQLEGPWTIGFSALGIAGFGVDYPANATNNSGTFNPLAAPQSAGGYGSIYSNYQFMQLTIGGSYAASPTLAYGIALNVDWSSLAVAPWPATPPNASGYPTGAHAATAWGKGLTLSTTYQHSPELTLGATFKSPQIFSEFKWSNQYPDGAPANFNFQLDYPMIIGAGLSYKKDANLILAADIKWINYSATEGFAAKNFSSAKAVQGFGWEDIWTLSVGAQYLASPQLTLRAGYNYGENPIPDDQQMFNVFAPAIVQHHLTMGLGYAVSSALQLNLSYYRVFEASVSGPLISNGSQLPLNQAIPGTTVTNTLSEDSFSAQLALKF